MKFKSCDKMQKAIEQILESHHLLETFRSTEEFYVKISNEPYMPLTIEKNGNQVVVAHYYTQNGDLMPDPDVEFEIYQGVWLPVAIQHSTGKYVRTMEGEGEKRILFLDDYDDLHEFSDFWAGNLLDQGFTKGKVERVE